MDYNIALRPPINESSTYRIEHCGSGTMIRTPAGKTTNAQPPRKILLNMFISMFMGIVASCLVYFVAGVTQISALLTICGILTVVLFLMLNLYQISEVGCEILSFFLCNYGQLFIVFTSFALLFSGPFATLIGEMQVSCLSSVEYEHMFFVSSS